MRHKYPNPANWSNSLFVDHHSSVSSEPHEKQPPKFDLINQRDRFDPDKLTGNELECNNGQVVAKLPRIPGRISIREDGRVELIIHRYYDKESKQTRNNKVIIGTDISGYLKGMMMPNDAYYDYIDRQGKLVYPPLIQEIEEQKQKEEEKKRIKEEREIAKQQKQNKQQQDQPTELQQPEETELTDQQMEESLLKLKKELTEKEKALNKREQELDEYARQLESREAELENKRMLQIFHAEEDKKDHIKLLSNILNGFRNTVEIQAKRKPDVSMSRRQIQDINELLEEIRTILDGCEMENYLHLAEEPDPEHDIPGTTYAEMSFLLTVYYSTLYAYYYDQLRYGEISRTGKISEIEGEHRRRY